MVLRKLSGWSSLPVEVPPTNWLPASPTPPAQPGTMAVGSVRQPGSFELSPSCSVPLTPELSSFVQIGGTQYVSTQTHCEVWDGRVSQPKRASPAKASPLAELTWPAPNWGPVTSWTPECCCEPSYMPSP